VCVNDALVRKRLRDIWQACALLVYVCACSCCVDLLFRTELASRIDLIEHNVKRGLRRNCDKAIEKTTKVVARPALLRSTHTNKPGSASKQRRVSE
jgi:hypothetical protein